jgi:hypothetical protein
MVNIINNNKSNISPICSSSINSENNKLIKIISTENNISTLSNTTAKIQSYIEGCSGSAGVDSGNATNQNSKMLSNNNTNSSLLATSTTTSTSLNETSNFSLVIKRKQSELTTATATLNENDKKETLTSTTKYTAITKTNIIVNSTHSSLSSSYSSVSSSPSSSQTSFNQNETNKALFNENLLKFNQQVHTSNNIALNKLMPLNNTPSNLNILAATATAVNNSMPFKSALRAKKVIIWPNIIFCSFRI